MKKTAAESHLILVEVYSEHALAERTCQKWFARFKSDDFGLEDEERPGQPKKFEDDIRIVISDLKNPRVPTFSGIRQPFRLLTRLL